MQAIVSLTMAWSIQHLVSLVLMALGALGEMSRRLGTLACMRLPLWSQRDSRRHNISLLRLPVPEPSALVFSITLTRALPLRAVQSTINSPGQLLPVAPW